MFQCAPEIKETLSPRDSVEMLAFNTKSPNTPEVIYHDTDNSDTHMDDVTAEEVKSLPQKDKNK